MFDGLKLIGSIANPKTLVLVLQAMRETTAAIAIVRRLIKILSNGNGSQDLQDEIALADSEAVNPRKVL